MKLRKISALLLSGAMALTLCACGGSKPAATTPAPTASASASPAETATGEKSAMNVAVLSGPTGVGAAKLMEDDKNGATAIDYNFTVAAANDEVTAMLTSGEADIAAVATNLAATLYNKTSGSIQVAALNTLGVLYILEGGGGSTVSSVKDLAGKTVYAVGQGANPEYVLNYILTQNGLTPGSDVTVQFSTPEEITAGLLDGSVTYAMLPVPAATAAIAKSKGSVRSALDLNAEWDALNTGSVLTMGCVVVRTEYAKEHADLVDTFLKEYAASIDYVKNNAEEASQMVADFGITPSAAIAAKAIPQCNLVCITGADIRPSIEGYYQVLFDANPDSIGGSIPDDAFYYVP